MNKTIFPMALISSIASMVLLLTAAGCGKQRTQAPVDQRRKDADKQVRAKYGKSLAELETVKLIIISPNNTDIEDEYERAFSLHHAVEFGRKVDIDWREVGGGSSAILQHLRNVYANSDRSGIDVVWGGGRYNFQRMAAEGIIRKMEIPADALANIPAEFGGISMYDPDHRWCGSALSGFGFLYNKPLLARLGRKPPLQWDDLAGASYYHLVGLADPMQSGSAAASYEMIVQSGGNWPDGWAKLLGILGNARKFYAGAGDAAEALPTGEVAVSTCIDFYGTLRVAKYPKTLVYVSPKGQTCFSPDPIAILTNPPHPVVAQRFVNFVLSLRGQALWALPAGAADGPVRASLGRLPIRKDVYTKYAGRLLPVIVNPYQAGQGMKIDAKLQSTSFGLLRRLVWAAAVKNRELLNAAKKKLIDTGFAPRRLALFNELPENISTRAKLAKVAGQLRDKRQADIITDDWIAFFRDKYKRVAK